MTRDHDNRRRPRGVSEPVQVYLAPPEQARLDRLTTQLAVSKSDVLRRGLEALEQQLTDPSSHPALQLIGRVDDVRQGSEEMDVAREHDRYLVESEVSSWSEGAREATEPETATAEAPSVGDSPYRTRPESDG